MAFMPHAPTANDFSFEPVGACSCVRVRAVEHVLEGPRVDLECGRSSSGTATSGYALDVLTPDGWGGMDRYLRVPVGSATCH